MKIERLFEPMNKRRLGKKQEKRFSRRTGSKMQPSSGAWKFAKGDNVLVHDLVENKTTLKKSISITIKWLVKISLEAISMGKSPALAFSFENLEALGVDKDWIAIPVSRFQELLEHERRNRKSKKRS